MNRARLPAVLAVLLLLTGTAASADSRIEFKTTEGKGASFSAMLIGHGKIRTDADKMTAVILDPTAGAVVLLDHGKRTFTRLTRADIDQLVKTMDDAMKQMEQAMARMPPEMKERMKGMMSSMGTMAGGAIERVDTGERATVAGRPCRIFRTRVAERVTNESCMADPSAIELPAADRATLTAALAWMSEFSERLSKGPLARIGAAMQMPGGLIPLRSSDIAPDGTRSTSEFAGVSTASIPASTFEVPDGYKEQKIDMPRMGRGSR